MLLANLSQQALQGTDPQHLLNSAMLAVGETLEVPIAAVSRLLPNGRELQVEAALGLKEETASKSRIKAGTASQAGFTLEYGKPVIVSDYASEPRFETTEVLARHQAVSGLSVVIMGRSPTK